MMKTKKAIVIETVMHEIIFTVPDDADDAAINAAARETWDTDYGGAELSYACEITVTSDIDFHG